MIRYFKKATTAATAATTTTTNQAKDTTTTRTHTYTNCNKQTKQQQHPIHASLNSTSLRLLHRRRGAWFYLVKVSEEPLRNSAREKLTEGGNMGWNLAPRPHPLICPHLSSTLASIFPSLSITFQTRRCTPPFAADG